MFKPGDKVICIDEPNYLFVKNPILGQIYTVIGYSGYSEIRVEGLEPNSWYEKRFEKVMPEYEFETIETGVKGV